MASKLTSTARSIRAAAEIRDAAQLDDLLDELGRVYARTATVADGAVAALKTFTSATGGFSALSEGHVLRVADAADDANNGDSPTAGGEHGPHDGGA